MSSFGHILLFPVPKHRPMRADLAGYRIPQRIRGNCYLKGMQTNTSYGGFDSLSDAQSQIYFEALWLLTLDLIRKNRRKRRCVFFVVQSGFVAASRTLQPRKGPTRLPAATSLRAAITSNFTPVIAVGVAGLR